VVTSRFLATRQASRTCVSAIIPITPGSMSPRLEQHPMRRDRERAILVRTKLL
jgi:hypothetical protein